MWTAKLVLSSLILFSSASFAQVRIDFLGNRVPLIEAAVADSLKLEFDLTQYREVRIHLIASASPSGIIDHAVIYLMSKKYHHFDLASALLDQKGTVISVIKNYKLQERDRPQTARVPQCPDESVEFIAFAPNSDALEQSVTVDVAKSALSRGLKTVQLLKGDATTENYLNYMACPNLKGNFYDGDANPEEIVTYDGAISATVIQTQLSGAFRYHVTNIWLACEAYNDPLQSTMLQTAQAQKYAAGINDLEIGPSDNAAACAMKAALNGSAMTAAFHACYTKVDVATDLWGFGGAGSDYFGH